MLLSRNYSKSGLWRNRLLNLITVIFSLFQFFFEKKYFIFKNLIRSVLRYGCDIIICTPGSI